MWWFDYDEKNKLQGINTIKYTNNTTMNDNLDDDINLKKEFPKEANKSWEYFKKHGKLPDKVFQWTDEKVKQFAEYILSDGFHVQTTPKMAAEYYFQLFKDVLSLTKPEPKKEPLFITEDGVEYFDYHKAIYKVTDNWEVVWSTALPEEFLKGRTFSTKQAAEQFIRDNKPSISYKQLRDYQESHGDLTAYGLVYHFKPK